MPDDYKNSKCVVLRVNIAKNHLKHYLQRIIKISTFHNVNDVGISRYILLFVETFEYGVCHCRCCEV